MDFKKDTSISFDSVNFKNSLVFKLFEKDSYLLFLYKKLERFVSAFYLVSNLLSDNEPIKWQLRKIGINTLTQSLSLASKPLSRPEIVHQIASDLVKLLSMLDIAYVSGLISNMNRTILKKELENLLETLGMKDFSTSGHGGSKALFDKEFFAIPSDHLVVPDTDASRAGSSESAVRFPGRDSDFNPQVRTWAGTGKPPPPDHKGHTKGQRYIKDRILSLKDRVTNNRNETHGESSHRRAIILELLKAKSNLTIKDFITVIKNCSGKTIQRELLRLVELGVLKKEGERRWSRYSLAIR